MKKMLLNYEMSMKTSNAYVVPRMTVIDVDVKSLMMTGSDEPEYVVGSADSNTGNNDDEIENVKTQRWNDAW